jgi:two-component system response regulator DctR
MTGTVHVVDDEEVIRDSLTWLFESADLACLSWKSGEEFLSHASIEGTACVILDVRMDGLNGLAVFQSMIERGSQVPVIFLTGHAEVPLAVEALKIGAFDFVEKPFNDNRLVDIVRAALERHDQLRSVASDQAGAVRCLDSLTPRENQVLELMIRGQMNKQIAGVLDLSIRTIEVHRASILEKFGVRSAVELAGIIARLKAAG